MAKRAGTGEAVGDPFVGGIDAESACVVLTKERGENSERVALPGQGLTVGGEGDAPVVPGDDDLGPGRPGFQRSPRGREVEGMVPESPIEGAVLMRQVLHQPGTTRGGRTGEARREIDEAGGGQSLRWRP